VDPAFSPESELSISVKTRKMLWGRGASRCNEPKCRLELVMDISETDDPTLVGEECHIVAKEENGPRGRSDLTPEQRDLYGNLMLMCAVHHKVIDDNPVLYDVALLHEMKKQHEAWVRHSLEGFDPARQREEEQLAGIIQEWEQRARLNDWDAWVSSLTCNGQPRILEVRMKELHDLGEWLFRRIWPDVDQDIQAAFSNFRSVLQDLLNLLREYGEEFGSGEDQMWQVRKLYKRIRPWSREREAELLAEYEWAVDLVEDLAVELTRAANLVIRVARKHFQPIYRQQEGWATITSGPGSMLQYTTFLPQYAVGVSGAPYEGIDTFSTVRTERDVHFGSGATPREPKSRSAHQP
jgi:hypothetical protein